MHSGVHAGKDAAACLKALLRVGESMAWGKRLGHLFQPQHVEASRGSEGV